MKKIMMSLLISVYFFSLTAKAMNPQESKIYAAIKPPAYYIGVGEVDMGNFVVEFYHSWLYENINGYSLGHELSFFSSLEKAKARFDNSSKEEFAAFKKSRGQDAIIEINIDESGDLSLVKMHTIYGYGESHMNRVILDGVCVSEKILYLPEWTEKSGDKISMTPGALEEIKRQYNRSLNH